VCVGLSVGARWGHKVTPDFYTTASQVIATLFVAVAIEFLARAATERRPYEATTLLLLVLMGWTGFFACLRALAGDATGVTAGAAAGGVTAAQLLTSLALYDLIVRSERGRGLKAGAVWLACGFLAAPVLVVVVA
jgi:hypothetical protein